MYLTEHLSTSIINYRGVVTSRGGTNVFVEKKPGTATTHKQTGGQRLNHLLDANKWQLKDTQKILYNMEKTKIIPRGDRVLIKIAPAETVRESGIIIPDTVSKDMPVQGVVEAVGEGRSTDYGHFIHTTINVGDVVLFSKYGPEEIKVGEDRYYLINEDKILAIIK